MKISYLQNISVYYTSEVLGMDNVYQIYLKDTLAIFNFRGTTTHTISWIENLQISMISAKGEIETEAGIFNYCFAQDENASVHAGYSLEIAFLEEGILNLFILFLKSSELTLRHYVSKELGHIKMPDYTYEVDYFYVRNTIKIPPSEFPKVLIDSTRLKNDPLLAAFATDSSYHLNPERYVQEPKGFQHKPYNYFMSFLKVFHLKEYHTTHPKVLPEHIY